MPDKFECQYARLLNTSLTRQLDLMNNISPSYLRHRNKFKINLSAFYIIFFYYAFLPIFTLNIQRSRKIKIQSPALQPHRIGMQRLSHCPFYWKLIIIMDQRHRISSLNICVVPIVNSRRLHLDYKHASI